MDWARGFSPVMIYQQDQDLKKLTASYPGQQPMVYLEDQHKVHKELFKGGSPLKVTIIFAAESSISISSVTADYWGLPAVKN